MWARESWSGFPDGQREENMWVRQAQLRYYHPDRDQISASFFPDSLRRSTNRVIISVEGQRRESPPTDGKSYFLRFLHCPIFTVLSAVTLLMIHRSNMDKRCEKSRMRSIDWTWKCIGKYCRGRGYLVVDTQSVGDKSLN